MPSRNGKPLGNRGESFAADHLETSGWVLLARNFRLGRKEIDIVARRGDVVAFVEVKTRSGTAYGHPLEAVTWRKRQEIQQVASAWIRRFGQPTDVYRFDAIAIRIVSNGPILLEHVEDAWRI